MPRQPLLLEINSLVFLEALRAKTKNPALTLGTVEAQTWKHFANLGFDTLWLMGLWTRSPASKQEALNHSGLRRDLDKALPGWTPNDVSGSPYAVTAYSIDSLLGTTEELRQLKTTLNKLGMKLITDFVPNHIGTDHPWVINHPEFFLSTTPEIAGQHPGIFFPATETRCVAHGKDPYFPPWTDTAQLNHFSPSLRTTLIEELKQIASLCDGVRCDMAMLCLNSVFQNTWGWLAGETPPPIEFWSEAIRSVREQHPDFLFIAEAYWGLEEALIDLGFDYAYDKTLYDLLRHKNAPVIRDYLTQHPRKNTSAVRFIENHDEERAVSAFGEAKSKAAVVAIATLPGMRLFHDGQLEGKSRRLPVQLRTPSREEPNKDLFAFYSKLLKVISDSLFQKNQWAPLPAVPCSNEDHSYSNLLSWMWHAKDPDRIVVINYSPESAQGQILIPHAASELPSSLNDLMTDKTASLKANSNGDLTLTLSLAPWDFRIYSV